MSLGILKIDSIKTSLYDVVIHLRVLQQIVYIAVEMTCDAVRKTHKGLIQHLHVAFVTVQKVADHITKLQTGNLW
jgi:hypothetical protein